MMVVELAACHVPEDPASPVQSGGGDTLWHVWHSMSQDLVFQHTNFSIVCCSSMV
jgi:hypothetical protein